MTKEDMKKAPHNESLGKCKLKPVRDHFTLTRMAKIKNTEKTDTTNLSKLSVGLKWYDYFGKKSGNFYWNSRSIYYKIQQSVPGGHPAGVLQYGSQKMWSRIVKTQKQSKWPSKGGWINKL